MEKVGEAKKRGKMSKGKKGKRGERGGKDRPKPYKKLSKEVEVIGESSKKKNRDDKAQNPCTETNFNCTIMTVYYYNICVI